MTRYMTTVLAAFLASTAVQPLQARDSIQAATWIPPSHQVSRYLFDYWADRVAERSDG